MLIVPAKCVQMPREKLPDEQWIQFYDWLEEQHSVGKESQVAATVSQSDSGTESPTDHRVKSSNEKTDHEKENKRTHNQLASSDDSADSNEDVSVSKKRRVSDYIDESGFLVTHVSLDDSQT